MVIGAVPRVRGRQSMQSSVQSAFNCVVVRLVTRVQGTESTQSSVQRAFKSDLKGSCARNRTGASNGLKKKKREREQIQKHRQMYKFQITGVKFMET